MPFYIPQYIFFQYIKYIDLQQLSFLFDRSILTYIAAVIHALIKIIELSYSLNSSATTVSTRHVTSIVIDALSECYKLFSTLITNKDLIHNTHPPISPLP